MMGGRLLSDGSWGLSVDGFNEMYASNNTNPHTFHPLIFMIFYTIIFKICMKYCILQKNVLNQLSRLTLTKLLIKPGLGDVISVSYFTSSLSG